MLFNAPLAPLAVFKRRLGITDDIDDVMLTELLLEVSGTFDGYVGRPLRRNHKVIENPRGGSETIRLRMSHIAKIHSVRESDDRDFDDSDNYEELVEGTDYVLEQGNGGELPGETGIIRRLNGTWLGTQTAPGRVQIVYTGGFKTDGEVEIENQSVTISGAGNILDYSIDTIKMNHEDQFSSVQDQGEDDIEVHTAAADMLSGNSNRIAIIRFDTASVVPQSASVVTAVFGGSVHGSDGAGDGAGTSIAGGLWKLILLDKNPQADTLSAILARAVESIDSWDIDLPKASATYSDFSSDLISESNVAKTIAETAVSRGFIAVAVLLYPSPVATYPLEHGRLAGSANATATQPSITIGHRTNFSDQFTVPHDLRNAMISQATFEYQNRFNPGAESRTARGVAIASGNSLMTAPFSLLPGVKEILDRYRRI